MNSSRSAWGHSWDIPHAEHEEYIGCWHPFTHNSNGTIYVPAALGPGRKQDAVKSGERVPLVGCHAG
jgi:hypothetical protein